MHLLPAALIALALLLASAGAAPVPVPAPSLDPIAAIPTLDDVMRRVPGAGGLLMPFDASPFAHDASDAPLTTDTTQPARRGCRLFLCL
ncbi:hypothetical protein C8R44DRAFT_782334 [Mycena epipterygia]|nr:hypothetical protein C8R44DRAFT_782334 [Mycena epipterygia]